MKEQYKKNIPFSTYMSQSLYGKNGYYNSPHRVGKDGDFYTSVSASKFFGGSIASYILSLLEENLLQLPLRIVEIGAEKGYLLGDIALFLDALSQNVLQECTFISIEPLSASAQAQKTYFNTLTFSTPLCCETFESLDICPIPTTKTSLFIISNELFDSFPCEVINNNKMLYIAQQNDKWNGIWQDITPEIKNTLSPHINPQSKTVMPLWNPFILSLSNFAKAHSKSYFVSFDYGGYGLEQVLNYNPRFYYQHKTLTLASFLEQNGDFRLLYQKTDITYDVDFELLDLLLCKAGFRCIFRASQAHVLISKMHILSLLESFSSQKGHMAYLKEIQKVKTIIHTMGERFIGICYSI